ncbi:MAG TPA: glycine cleavage system protein GcvH [Candidatus Acetothermia bacterium]|nr:glycine cleavage system protein GcvH [Candidatus Acetothermia bacterium]
MSYPNEYRYTEEHEWVKVEGKEARIGITDHAQHELGDIVFVELPAVGVEVKRGENLGTVESVKAVGDVYAPVSGKVTAVNEELEGAPETINRSPHQDGWIAVIEMSDPTEVDSLLTAPDYEKYVAEG